MRKLGQVGALEERGGERLKGEGWGTRGEGRRRVGVKKDGRDLLS